MCEPMMISCAVYDGFEEWQRRLDVIEILNDEISKGFKSRLSRQQIVHNQARAIVKEGYKKSEN